MKTPLLLLAFLLLPNLAFALDAPSGRSAKAIQECESERKKVSSPKTKEQYFNCLNEIENPTDWQQVQRDQQEELQKWELSTSIREIERDVDSIRRGE